MVIWRTLCMISSVCYRLFLPPRCKKSWEKIVHRTCIVFIIYTLYFLVYMLFISFTNVYHRYSNNNIEFIYCLYHVDQFTIEITSSFHFGTFQKGCSRLRQGSGPAERFRGQRPGGLLRRGQGADDDFKRGF